MKHENREVRIPITMCHGTSWQPQKAKHQKNLLTVERYFGVAAELGFQSISYDELALWRSGNADLPLLFHLLCRLEQPQAVSQGSLPDQKGNDGGAGGADNG
jgi:hypothetical protein